MPVMVLLETAKLSRVMSVLNIIFIMPVIVFLKEKKYFNLPPHVVESTLKPLSCIF